MSVRCVSAALILFAVGCREAPPKLTEFTPGSWLLVDGGDSPNILQGYREVITIDGVGHYLIATPSGNAEYGEVTLEDNRIRFKPEGSGEAREGEVVPIGQEWTLAFGARSERHLYGPFREREGAKTVTRAEENLVACYLTRDEGHIGLLSSIRLRADNTFTLISTVFLEGSWRLEGDVVTLAPKNAGGIVVELEVHDKTLIRKKSREDNTIFRALPRQFFPGIPDLRH